MLTDTNVQNTTSQTADNLAKQLQNLPPSDPAAISAAVAEMHEQHPPQPDYNAQIAELAPADRESVTNLIGLYTQRQAATEVQPPTSSAPETFAASDYIHRVDTIEHQEDEGIRSDPHLRLEAVTLVEALADALADSAGRLAVARQDNSPWGEDKARADLLWQLSEFLCLAEWSREDRADNLLQHWQLDGERARRYACDWFRVDIMSDGRLETQPVEAS